MVMQKYLHLTIIGVGLIISGCSGKNQTNDSDSTIIDTDSTMSAVENIERSVEIDFDKAEPISSNLKIAGNVSFDDSDDNILSIPHHIVVKGDTIFAIDPVKSPGVYAYRKDGRQIFAYCSHGGGPEDISSPMNLTVRNTDIAVYDFANKKMLYISKQGDFIKSVALPPSSLSAALDPSHGICVDYSNQGYSDTKLSLIKDSISNEKIILKVPEYLKGMTMLPMTTVLNLPDNSLRYYPPLETEIYDISNGEASIIYRLDFKGKWPSKEEFERKYSGNDWAPKMRDFPIRSKGYSENDNWLVLGYTYDKNLYIVVFDKTRDKAITYIDSEGKYYNPLYVDGSELYMQCQDDTIDILDLN